MLGINLLWKRHKDRKAYSKHISSPNPASPEWEAERRLLRKRAIQLTLGELKQICKGDIEPLFDLPKEDWVDAIGSVDLPKEGENANLDMEALHVLTRIKTRSDQVSPPYTRGND